MTNSKLKNQGFSLLGVMITIFITSVGLLTILSLAVTSIKSSALSEARLIASGLAQEGVEVVRGFRRAQIEWDDWYSSVSSGDYRVQYDSASLMSFSETPLKLDTTSGLYQYDTGNNSPFYRKVSLTKVSDNEVKVLVEVKWQLKGNWHYLTVEERLWNWK
jgi:Tfp pilus assembly protein PilV